MEHNGEPKYKHTNSPLIFNRRGKNIKWEKNSLFSMWCWESWTAASKSIKLEYNFISCTKINSKWLKDLNTSHNTIKPLEESIGKTFSDINCTNVFLGQSPKEVEIKTYINKWDIIKLTCFCKEKKTILKKKKKTNYWTGEIFANDETDKGLISKVYKQLMQFNSKETNNPIKNGTLIDISPNKTYRWPVGIWRDAQNHY